MTIPTNFDTAISSKDVSIRRWIEIEGIPYAYGTMAQSSSFFSARAAALRFLGIRGQLASIPRNLDQEVDTLEGGALSVGQTDFEITDDDGEPTKWAGVGYTTNRLSLNGAITAAATTLTFFGSAAGYAANDYIYVGHETIQIGAVVGQTFTGCTRGLFRTTARAWASGYPISLRPYSMANRRCWYNEVAVSISAGTALSSTDPDRCVRFAGTLRGFRLKDDQHNSYILTAESLDRELDRPCFRRLRTFALNGQAIKDALGKDGNTTAPGWPGFTPGASADFNQTDSLFNMPLLPWPTNGENTLMQCDDEIFQVKKVAASGLIPGMLKIIKRGLFGTEAVKHESGAIFKEVVAVYRGQSGYTVGLPEIVCSKFTSAVTTNAPLQADHPLMLILQVLLSTGTGTNTGGGGTRNYDVLPADWGMGVDYTRVNIAAIEAAAMEEPTLKFNGIINQPINFIAFMRDMLRIAGYYYIVTVGDQFTIRRLRPPLPDVATTAITNAHRIRKFFTKWEANWSGAIRELVFRFGWDINESKFRRTVVFRLGDGDVYNQVTRLDGADPGRTGIGSARSLTLESKFLYPGKSGIPGELASEAWDIDQWLLARADFFMTRYGRPPPIIRERLDYSFLDLEIGDLVNVTHSNLPDAATGARGISAAVGEVIGKAIDDESKTISVTILLTSWMLGSDRFIAPALKVESVIDINHFVYVANQFTEVRGPFASQTQNDGSFENSAGTLIPPFVASASYCWMFSSDFVTKHACSIGASGISAGSREVHCVPDGGAWPAGLGGASGPTVGSFLVFRDFQTCADEDTSDPDLNYAFMADTLDTLGSSNTPAHKISLL